MSDNLTQISILICRIALPINIFLGVIGNIINISVLTRPGLIKYASSHFFLAMAVNNLIGSAFVSTNDLLSIGYKINLNLVSSISCKLVRYFSDLCALFSFYFIVLASIDRYCASSPSVNRRRWSSIRVARCLIISIVIIFAVFYINTLVLIEIDRTDRLGCAIRPKNIYHQIYPIVQILIYTILAPCLMVIFGMLTIYHTKKVRMQPGSVITQRRTERQLTLMLLVQVATNILLNLPISILYLMTQFLPSRYITAEFYFILMISRYICEFSYSSPFFLYIMSGRTFQKELICLINRVFHYPVINQVQPIRTQNNLTGRQNTVSTLICK